jgi:tRNA(His) guanylyltransferase
MASTDQTTTNQNATNQTVIDQTTMVQTATDRKSPDIIVNLVTFGERMKSYEKDEYINPQNGYLVRMDGKTFSSFTNQFQKPFDEKFTKAMTYTLNQLVKHYNAYTGFCCSDEITLVFPPIHGKMTEHQLSGRKNKIATLCAGKCSALFIINLTNIFAQEKNDKMLDYVIRYAPCFDARVIEIPSDKLIDVCNNLIWRSLYDCRRNSISTYARYHLGAKAVKNKDSREMIDMMKEKGFDIESLKTRQIYGVYAKRKKVLHNDPKFGVYMRNEIFNFECVLKATPETLKFILSKSCTLEDIEQMKKDPDLKFALCDV